jgi:signal transduction histidine kinase
MGSASDEQIAAALAAAHEGIVEHIRQEQEGSLRALATAFRTGRWGSFYCRFEDPVTALRRLADLAVAVAPQLLPMPNAASLVGRLLETVVEMSIVVASGERVGQEREIFELQELLRVKDDFLRLAVHEMRGPVGRMNGYLSMISEGDFDDNPESRHQAVEQLSMAAGDISGQLESLTAIAQINDRADVLRRTTCDLSELMEAATRSVEEEASRKHIHLDLDSSGAQIQVRWDRGLMSTALTNLIGNAIKYSPERSNVTLRARQGASGIMITVGDDGPGLAAPDAQRVFEKYYRANAEASGLGLGLYLVRRIVELHGGSITLNSELGQGTIFNLFMPVT